MPQSGQVLSRSGQANVLLPMHSHHEAQLIVGLSGAAIVGTVDEEWELPPRSMLWVEGDLSHRVRTSVDHRALVLSFPPHLVARTTGWVRASGFVHDLVERVAKAPDSERRDRLAAVLVDELVEPLPVNERLERVVGLVARYPAMRAAALARGLGMSERSFRRWFRADVGTSFTVWHQRRIVERAVERLHHGDSVKSVATDLGYTNPSAFIALFKRVTGVTPRRYSRRAR